jgi:hypothetical protein
VLPDDLIARNRFGDPRDAGLVARVDTPVRAPGGPFADGLLSMAANGMRRGSGLVGIQTVLPQRRRPGTRAGRRLRHLSVADFIGSSREAFRWAGRALKKPVANRSSGTRGGAWQERSEFCTNKLHNATLYTMMSH